MAADPTIPRRGQSVTRAQLALNRAAGLKHCFSCKETMAAELFSVDKSRPDGRQPKCKGCYAAWKAANRVKAKGWPCDAWRAAYRDAIKINYRTDHADRLRAKSRDWNAKNKERFTAYAKAWRQENIERSAAARKRWKEANADALERQRVAYTEKNRGRIAAHARTRQAKKLRATPSWANIEAVKRFYVHAELLTRTTGIPHHVDHIVPLKGRNVCGLHWEGNLQVLPGAENIAKGNRSWPDMWEIAGERSNAAYPRSPSVGPRLGQEHRPG